MSDNTERKLHIAFASAEAAPFVKTGGLGDVAGSLPQALKAAGAKVVVLVPKYDTIAQEYKDRMEHLCDFYVPLGWRNEYCGIERLVHNGVDYLFIDNERYFSRGYPYGFFDDGERFAFFSKAIVESLQYLPYALDFTCDVLHCNDWHTAMAPVFLREFYQALPLYQNVKCVFSIHNIAFQGQFTAKILNDILGLAHIPAAAFQLTCGPDAINYMMGALNYTDSITTVSPTYAEEIKTAEYGEHLDGILRRRAPILQGIVNGIDTTGFDPANDPRIAANFTRADRSGKAVCKAELQRELGLEVRDDRPLMVMVTRLTRQKGMDLVTYALDRILSGGVQVAVLGTGDTEYENALRYFEGKYPGTMAARIQFDPALSQRMYAGADLFLMPSLFEPCGLSQMIAMRYGTLPVVRETGGLRDTVAPYNQFTGEGTGFSFTNFNGDEMGDAVFRAARLFWDDRAAFDKLVDNAMAADFSWKHSAEAYMALYHNLHPEIPLPAVTEVAEEAAAETTPVEAAAPAVDEKVAPAAEEPAVEKADEPVAAPAAPVTEQLPLDDAPAAAPVAAEPVKKTPAKKPVAKKAAVKKTAVKAEEAVEVEPAAEKPVTAKKAPAKKTATRKTAVTKTATAKSATATETTTAKESAAKATTVKAAPAAKATAAKTATATKAASTKAVSTKASATKPATAKTSAAKSAAAKATAAKAEPVTPAAAVKAPTAKTSTPKTVAAKAATAKTTTAKTAATKPAATTATAAATAKKTATATTAKSTAAKTTAAKAAAPKITSAKAAASPAAEVKATATVKAATAKTAATKTTAAKTASPAAKATTATKAAAAAKPAAEPAAKAEAPAKKTVSKMVPKVSRAKRK